MQYTTRSYSPSGSNGPANRNSTLHPSTTASSGESTSCMLGNDDTTSAASVQAEDAICSVSSVNISPEMGDGVQFGNSTAQPDAGTTQLNLEPENQHPSEETFMMSDHKLSIDGNTQKRSRQYTLKKAARGWWLWEIGGAVLSIGCMIAILIIIPYIHNQPLKNWRFMVAPNTMISTLITVSKTSMLLAVAAGIGQLKWQNFHRSARPISELEIYDEASRGPWGALVFGLMSPFRWRDMIAIFGAFVMLSSLTLEPLAQQLLSFETRCVSQDNGIAWISTATTYGQISETTQDALEVHAQYLVLQGLLGSPPSLSYTCSSNECSWSDFSSLGICSTCANVTSNCSIKDIPAQNHSTFHGANYTTPRGITLPISVSEVSTGIPAIVTSGNTTSKGATGHGDITFVAIANASGPPIFDHSVSEYKYRRPDITECKISWCARFYSNLEMTNSTLTSYTMEEQVFFSEETHSDTFGQCSNVTFRATRGGTSNQFTIGCDKLYAVSRYLEDLFEFQIYTDDTVLTSEQLIANSESVSAAMDTITNAFSMYLMTSTANTTRHYGKALYPEVFVIIRWQWLIFPGILTIIGASFLGTSLWISRTHRTSFLWKASLVPLLFHGLSGWEKDDLYTKDKIEMDERAKRMQAKLEIDNSRSLKFVKA